MWYIVQASISLFLVVFLAVGSAANAWIGVARARGNFRVDDATVYRNSTIFDGSAVETGMVPAELQLAGGARLLLAPSSKSKVYGDRAVLEKGTAQLKGPGNYPVEARTLRIVQAGPDSTAQVILGKTNEVQVAALAGTVQVTNSQGLVVANLMPGSALTLNPQEGTPPTRVTLSSLHFSYASSNRASQSRCVLPPPRASISSWVGADRSGVIVETYLV